MSIYRHCARPRLRLFLLFLFVLLLLTIYFKTISQFTLKSLVLDLDTTQWINEAPSLAFTEKQKPKRGGLPVLERPRESSASKLGQLGEAAYINNLTADEKQESDRLWNLYGINHFLSQKISSHRLLRDPRPSGCKKRFDYDALPSATVIIVLFNEGWSTLIRTIYSVLHNTPDQLLDEVILVDDYSDHPHLKQPFEDYLKYLPKVRLIRTTKREGLIRARLLGLEHAKSEVIAFVDSHCECTTQWLEPLVEQISRDNSTIAVPVTDDVDSKTFKYYYGSPEPNIGGFTWQLYFHWRGMTNKQRNARKSLAEPIPTPTISGGLFAVNRKFFLHIGSYDSGMDVWGGENVEISFRTWMCGGKVVVFPCSHIGHVSRDINTYSKETFWKNVMRVAEVWLDDYKRHFYARLPNLHPKPEPGDVSERKKLRERLKCHDFSWYIKNVYPEQHIPEDRPGFYGSITNFAKSGYCFDVASIKGISMILFYPCHGMTNQFFEYTSSGELRVIYLQEECAEVGADGSLTYSKCASDNGEKSDSQLWTWDKSRLIQNRKTKTCIEAAQNYKLSMQACDSKHPAQQWAWR